MSRKTRIIISITGIILVVLIMLGLTYGYYFARVYGNENSKSVTVVTGDSTVLFTDLSENDTNVIIEPGVSNIKTFKVENTGNISATYSIFLVNVKNNFVRKEDITYKLYRVGNTDSFPENYVGCVENPSDENACKIVINDAIYPSKDSLVIGNETITNPDDYYTYQLVSTYINHPTINQDVDQGKIYSGKINIFSTDSDENISQYDSETLAYHITQNALNKTYGTSYRVNALTTPGVEDSGSDEATLSKTMDDAGETYYFRGNVKDNYVNFNGMCWRIVRIEGDGGLKLILEDRNELCGGTVDVTTYADPFTGKYAFYGYDNSSGMILADYLSVYSEGKSTNNFNSTGMNEELYRWFNSSPGYGVPLFSDETKALLKDNTKWCLGNTKDMYMKYDPYSHELLSSDYQIVNYEKDALRNALEKGTEWWRYFYESKMRFAFPDIYGTATLECNTDKHEYVTGYIGTLTADEVAFAGLIEGGKNATNYLSSNGAITVAWPTLTQTGFYVNATAKYDAYYRVIGNGLGTAAVGVNSSAPTLTSHSYVRPVISLKPGTLYQSGEGTVERPYVIE